MGNIFGEVPSMPVDPSGASNGNSEIEKDPYNQEPERPVLTELQSYLQQNASRESVDYSVALAPERISRLLSTPDMRKAFGTMRAETSGPDATKEKQRAILDFLETGLSDCAALSTLPTVYIGSGYDFEYPLLLGARQIRMVNPDLNIERLEERVASVVDKAALQRNGQTFRFPFDFGQGTELVEIGVDSAYYGGTDEQLPKAQLPNQIGMVIGYASGDFLKDLSIFKNIVSGGYIFEGTATRLLMASLSDEKLGSYLNEVKSGQITSPQDLVRRIWSDEGYDVLPQGLKKKR